MSGLQEPLADQTMTDTARGGGDTERSMDEHGETRAQLIAEGHSFWADLFMVAEAKDIAQHLMDRWNNVGVVAALCATMAVTLDVLDSSDYTGDERPQAEVFAAVTGVSFVLSLASVLASLILFVQVNNLFRDEDIKWFIKETEAYHFLPSKLLMSAIATLVIGHAVMIAMMYNDITSWIVGIGSFITLGFCYWFYDHLRGKVDNRLCQLVSNVEELRMVFDLIDTKKRNKVSVEKMKRKLQDPVIQNYIQVAASRIDKVVAMIDADGDGVVTWEEFRDHLSNRRMTSIFTNMDLDGDGQISSDEFRKFYLGADLDGDGQISAAEMQEFMKNSTPGGTPRDNDKLVT
jgi:Ca2+-binding EF-hand superfamily protein